MKMDIILNTREIVMLFVVCVIVFCYPLLDRMRKCLPRGPFPLPLIGCLHLLGKEPHKSVAALSCKYGPVMSLRLGTVDAVFVSSTEAAKIFLKTHDKYFATRPPMTVVKDMFYAGNNVSFALYGEGWKKTRRMCVTELFSAQTMDSFRQAREHYVSVMMRRLWTRSREGTTKVDLHGAIFETLHEIIWSTIAGEPVSNELLDVPTELVDSFLAGSVYDVFPCLATLEPLLGIRRRMKKTWKKFDAFADNVVNEHAAAEQIKGQRKSFVDILLDISEEDAFFTKEKMKAVMLDLFLAGTFTPACTVEWLVSNLLKNPECLRKAQEEVDGIVGEDTVNESHVGSMAYLKWAMKESLRLNPIGQFLLPRQATEDVRMDEYKVPKGTRVFINVWAVGRDGDVWEDPEEFKPERHAKDEYFDMTGHSNLRMLAFGGGRRGCPGYNMAFRTMLLMVSTLLHTFELRVEGGPSALDMSVRTGVGLARKEHLCVLPKLRNKRGHV